MERKITKIDATKLAIGIQAILLEMTKERKEKGIEGFASYPISNFEKLIQESHKVSAKEAEKLTDRVVATGIIRVQLSNWSFVL